MPSTLTEKSSDDVEDCTWIPNEDEKIRCMRISRMLDEGLAYRQPYESEMERGLLLYDGKMKDYDTGEMRVVSPLGRAFVETKTSEEVKSMNGYTFRPGKKASDEWMVGIVTDVDEHVKRVTQQGTKKVQAIRMKNIVGTSILRVGYRKIMRTVKDPTKVDDDNNIIEWQERKVPVYDDVFTDIVSPFNFLVDSLAKTMDDAMWCAHYYEMHIEQFKEMYCDNKLYKNTEHVHGGVSGRFSFDGKFANGAHRSMTPYRGRVMIVEVWHKVRYEYVVLANGVEIYAGPLPDNHGELPFVSYHNLPCFSRKTGRDIVARSDDGSDTTSKEGVVADEVFWTIGDCIPRSEEHTSEL